MAPALQEHIGHSSRYVFLLPQDSPLHKALFWVAMAVLQLDEVNLYSAGTALLEQNLHTLDGLRVFNDKVSKAQTRKLQMFFVRPDKLLLCQLAWEPVA